LNITVAGTGYVGLSNAVLLSQHHQVMALDVLHEKVALINRRQSPVRDPEIQRFLSEKKLHLEATTDQVKAFKEADFVIVATPTNYDPEKNHFNTRTVEAGRGIFVAWLQVPAVGR